MRKLLFYLVLTTFLLEATEQVATDQASQKKNRNCILFTGVEIKYIAFVSSFFQHRKESGKLAIYNSLLKP